MAMTVESEATQPAMPRGHSSADRVQRAQAGAKGADGARCEMRGLRPAGPGVMPEAAAVEQAGADSTRMLIRCRRRVGGVTVRRRAGGWLESLAGPMAGDAHAPRRTTHASSQQRQPAPSDHPIPSRLASPPIPSLTKAPGPAHLLAALHGPPSRSHDPLYTAELLPSHLVVRPRPHRQRASSALPLPLSIQERAAPSLWQLVSPRPHRSQPCCPRPTLRLIATHPSARPRLQLPSLSSRRHAFQSSLSPKTSRCPLFAPAPPSPRLSR